MATRLKAYIRRTVLDSAREHAYPRKRRTAESTLSAFRDASQGVDTGWWNDLIYTADRLDLFNRYRGDVRSAVKDFLSETGANPLDPLGGYGSGAPSAFQVLEATLDRRTWADYIGENGEARAELANAATFGIGFAVEWLISDVAASLGVEL